MINILEVATAFVAKQLNRGKDQHQEEVLIDYLKSAFLTDLHILVAAFYDGKPFLKEDLQRPSRMILLLETMSIDPEDNELIKEIIFLLTSLQRGIVSPSVHQRHLLQSLANELITATQAAELAGFSRAYITQETYNILDENLSDSDTKGKLPSILLSSKTKLILKSDLYEWLKQRR